MLSNTDILSAITNSELTITPFKPQMIRGCSITLHLGPLLLQPIPGKVADPREHTVPEYTSINISRTHPFELAPGGFLLGHTLQKVTVGPTLGFLIEGRSTLARLGLTIVQTAMIVYPGHRDRAVTLELANHGPNIIRLYAEMKIARVALFRFPTPSSLTYDEDGKYRDQSQVGPPIFENEFF